MAQSPPATVEDEPMVTEEDTLAQVMNSGFDWNTISNEEERQEHDTNAVDYGDISDDDDDLPDEEPVMSQREKELESLKTTQGKDVETAESSFTGPDDGFDDGFEDLFGGGDEILMDETTQGENQVKAENEFDLDEELFGGNELDDVPAGHEVNGVKPSIEDDTQKEPVEEEDVSPELLEQQRLFAQSMQRVRGQDEAPAPAETQEQLIQQMFPGFKRGHTLKFTELLPSGRARYVGKTPVKPPKPVLPTKVSLDIARDQEKDFKLLAGGHKRTWEDPSNEGLIFTFSEGNTTDDAEDTDDASDVENEQIGGYSWQDFQIVCADWDVVGQDGSELGDDGLIHMELDDDAGFDNWEMGRPYAKRRKLEPVSDNILNSLPRYDFPSFSDPAKATAKIASRVVLDLNDPMLLVNEIQPEEDKEGHKNAAAVEHGDKRTQRLAARYNISNDQEYEQLTAQHQSKSRSTLGSLTVHHSLPALRLQWPYYKTKLEKQECRSFHRPHSSFPKMEVITFRTPKVLKKKHIRGQETTAIFNNTVDLSLGDNSHVLLLEYSEQHPTMMSNFGMNSRLINYYRRKDMEDSNRPKLDIGELSVLQPQDTSPLTQFGHIDPGETTPAIYNGMFKAPVFEQQAKSTDFVVARNATGVNGSNWYLRNIEYLRVVGQQLPSTEVPGPNARKVTTAAKNRLKMVSYRLLKKSKTQTITVSKVTPHVLDPSGGPSNDMQNRQKLKEFLQFNKEHKEWELKPGDILPASDKIRELVKPEDVCLLEAMQVGSQQLEDAGFGASTNAAIADDGQSDEEVENEDQNLEQSLVPWQTTKNFIQAANNKAMLQLHGEGDPTKRGEAFSMLKISMKGGFKAAGESITDKLDAAKIKELGGHSYNVAKQAESYNRSVRAIWEKQKESLSSNVEPDLDYEDEEEEEEEDPVLESMMDGPDMQLTKQAPQPMRPGRDDQSVSQFSHMSRGSQQGSGQILKITRRLRNRMGQEEEQTEIVRDPRVIRQYIKLRRYKEAESIDMNDLKNLDTTDPEIKKRIQAEILRLERNKDRRLGREKQKIGTSGEDVSSPGAGDAGDGVQPKAKGKGNTGGTGRKCANCGQIGHIKTNKKLCPMLNGTMKQEDNFGEQNFTLSTAQL